MGLLQNLIKGCKSPVFLYKFLFAAEKISNLEFIRGNFKTPQKSSKGTTFAQNKECFRRLPSHKAMVDKSGSHLKLPYPVLWFCSLPLF